MWNIAGPLATIQGELHWHVFDLCRVHQVMYADLNRQVQHLDERYAHFKNLLDEQRPHVSDEEMDWFHLQESRMNDSFLSKDLEIERLKSFSDEYSIIGLWAAAEQYLGKVFAHIEHHQTGVSIEDVRRPYRWDEFINQFNTKSITLSALNGYLDANECRVLNNTIKHAGVVNDRLAAFTYFAPHRGKKLSKVDFEMQRYVDGVFNFLGSLIESGNRLLDPSFAY